MKYLKSPPRKLPDHLGDDERAVFRKLCRQLIDGPGLRDVDLFVVELAAVSYCKWKKAKASLDELGMVVEVELKDGTMAYKSSAYAAEAHKFHREYVARLSDLGLVGRKKGSGGSAGSKSEKSTAKKSGLSRLRVFGSGA